MLFSSVLISRFQHGNHRAESARARLAETIRVDNPSQTGLCAPICVGVCAFRSVCGSARSGLPHLVAPVCSRVCARRAPVLPCACVRFARCAAMLEMGVWRSHIDAVRRCLLAEGVLILPLNNGGSRGHFTNSRLDMTNSLKNLDAFSVLGRGTFH